MVIHVVPFHDDAIGAATAGWCQGGTALTAALTYNDDLVVDVDDQGQLPYLTDVLMHEFDINGADIGTFASWSLRPNTWPSTATLSGSATHTSSQINGPLSVPTAMDSYITGKYNIPLTANLNWISSNSKVFASAANADIMFCLVYSYGTRYPFKGGNIIYVSAVSSGAVTADTWTQGWSQQLAGVGYGLDPSKNYVLRGVGGGNDAVDEVDMGHMATKQTGFHQMVGCGSGNDIAHHMTWYLHDGIPCTGTDAWTTFGLQSSTGTPWHTLAFEEY